MTNPDNQSQPTEYDSPWKEILKAYFKDFLAFFLPEAHGGIDWQRAPEFLDKELDRITKEAKAINRRVDLLVKVWLIHGDELWVLIHVEVQGGRDADEENQEMPYITSVERIGEEKGRLLGIQIGEQRGIQIGEQKGEAAILTRLLHHRFGAVPDWASEKIAKAELPSLEEWSLRIFDAQSLDDIFSDKT